MSAPTWNAALHSTILLGENGDAFFGGNSAHPFEKGITAVTILILSALTFLPILVLGPIAEAFQLTAGA